MANLPEVDQYDAGVYQFETTDAALGGANGVMNTPPKSLANRTRYLLNRILDGALAFVVDSGAVNAIQASFPQPIGALVDGMEVSFRVAITNTGATTLKLTNTGGPTLATLPLYGGDYAALGGGELTAGASVRAKLNASLNSGAGAWVIQSIVGGYAKIPTAPVGDATTKAANMAALFAAADGMATVNVGVGTDITLTAAQYGNAILKLTGTPTAAINLILPAQTGQWIIINQQGGTNNITVKPSGGAGVVLPQGNQTVIVCSDSATASFASAQAGQSFLTPVSITGVTGSTLTVPGGYTPGAIFIEKNGSLLEAPDFSATTSPTISLTKAAVSTDYFTVYRFTTFNVANAVQKSGDVLSGALVLAGGDTIAADPAASDNSTKLPSTKWVWNNILALVNSVIGTVTGVTQAIGDATTKLATTAFVARIVGTVGSAENRNIVMNSDGRFNQHGYASGTATTVANQVTLDGWRVIVSGQSLGVALLGTGGQGPGVTMTAPAGGVQQNIPGSRVAPSGGTYVCSWVGTATLTVNGTAVANGGTVTLPGGNATVAIVFSNGTFTQVKIEPGTVATPWSALDDSLGLLQCQQQFERFVPPGATNVPVGSGQCYSSTQALIFVPFKVTKRVAPTGINVSSAANFNLFSPTGSAIACTAIAFNSATPDGIWLTVTVASGLTAGNAALLFSSNANARIDYTGAEL